MEQTSSLVVLGAIGGGNDLSVEFEALTVNMEERFRRHREMRSIGGDFRKENRKAAGAELRGGNCSLRRIELESESESELHDL